MSPALLFISALSLQAPAAALPPVASVGEAYLLFLQSRQAEEVGKIDDALAALRKAAALLPGAAEIQAELAGVFAREGRASESVNAAEAALAIDGSNREAHRILGFVQAAVAGDPANASSAKTLVPEAIKHLEQALNTQVVDLSAQLLLSRLYAQTGQYEKAVKSIKLFLNEQPEFPEARGDAAKA